GRGKILAAVRAQQDDETRNKQTGESKRRHRIPAGSRRAAARPARTCSGTRGRRSRAVSPPPVRPSFRVYYYSTGAAKRAGTGAGTGWESCKLTEPDVSQTLTRRSGALTHAPTPAPPAPAIPRGRFPSPCRSVDAVPEATRLRSPSPPAAPRSPAAPSAAGATSRRYRASRGAPHGAGVARRRPVSTAAGGNGSRGMEGGRAPLREARLDEAEARRAECREAARLLARRNAELLCRQRRADRDAAAVLALLTEQGREKAAQIEKLKKELIDLKQQTQEENRKLEDYYTQQIKELEEKFLNKVGEISQIKLELNLIREFRIEKAAVEKEMEDVSLS
uniref:Basal body-orientation factor 1 n=1 Tax=Coturnix japonica TaxID=93934 RepID=A0A8C2UCD4_COTJA